MKSNLLGQGNYEVSSYCSRTLWSLILLVKDALTSYLIVRGRFEVLSYWSRTLWSLILLMKDALRSCLIGLDPFQVLSSRTLFSLLVLRRFNCVLIVMPCILVRSSKKMKEPSNSVAEDAFYEAKTYIDSSHDKRTIVMKAISAVLQPLTGFTSNEFMWFTAQPPFVVLSKLQDLGFSVVAANTVGVTTVWTLQGNPSNDSLIPIIRNHPFPDALSSKEPGYF